MFALFLLGLSAHAAEESSALIFDLMVGKQNVGTHSVQIKYLPTDKFHPEGSRLIESELKVDGSFMGQNIHHAQKSSATFSGSRGSFVSAVESGLDLVELQGRQQRDRRWSVHTIRTAGISQHVYSIAEMSTITLALFDPEQLNHHTTGVLGGLYVADTGDVLVGSWSEAVQEKRTIEGKEIDGIHRKVTNKEYQLDLFWNMEGLLLDWDLHVSGVVIDSVLRNVPTGLKFGEIQTVTTFDGVEGEEL